MFHSTLVVLAASAMVFASPSIIMSRSQCNSGAVSCCQDVQPAGSEAANNALFGLLDTALGVGIPIGIDCTPISVIGAGSSANCNASPVCCENNYSGGAVGVSCLPINLQG